MPIVKFLGQVLPNNSVRITSQSPSINLANPKTGVEGTISVSIVESKVTVVFDINQYLPSDFMVMFARAFDVSRACVDVLAFSMGVGLTVILDEFISPDGRKVGIVPQTRYLAGLCTAYQIEPGWNEDIHTIWAETINSYPLRMALNDLISGIVLPYHGPRVVAQVMETLRTLVSPDGLSKKDSWQYMRDMLRLDESYTMYVYNHGCGPRHGDRAPTDLPVQKEMSFRGWTMMNRYFEYVKRGRVQLPEADFPTLT